MNQIQKIMDDGLNINWEASTIEDLQNLDNKILQTRQDRMAIDPEDRYLSDQERDTRDMISFFITKKTYQNDKVSIGDVFNTSWGYEQTNIEFFQVVKISPTGKTCQVIQIGAKTVPGSEVPHGMADSVIPDPTNIINAKPCQVRIERHNSWNPISKKHEPVDKIGLRGSVYFAGDSKHLESLYRSEGSHYRSWYA